jgi:hypothetical protein
MLIGFFYLGPHKTVHSVFLTAGVNFVAIVMNITWLILYYSEFWNGEYIDSDTLHGSRRWEVILALILIVLEVLTMLLLLRLFWICKSASYKVNRPGYDMTYGDLGKFLSSNYHQNNFMNQWNMASGDGFFIERPQNFNAQYSNNTPAQKPSATQVKGNTAALNNTPGSPQPGQMAQTTPVAPLEMQSPIPPKK